MKIAVVGAMHEEITFLKNKLEDLEEKQIEMFTFYLGKLENHEIILVESGIGKTMAGVLSGILFTHFDGISCLINVGCAGGVSSLHILDVVVSSSIVYGDVDLRSGGFGYSYGQMAQCPKAFLSDLSIFSSLDGLDIHIGTICSCDSFTTSKEKTDFLQQTYFSDYSILCYDMESCSFAQAAYFFHVPFIAIRVVSDVIGENHQDNQYQNCYEQASEKSNLILMELLTRVAK